MPDVGASLRSFILTDVSIAAAVGTRIYSDHLPQNATLPAITYQVISEIANENLTSSDELDEARVQIDCYGSTRSAANSLQQDVRNLLMAYRGKPGDLYFKTITQATGQQYLTDRPESGTDHHRYITSQDFSVFYETT